VLNVAAVLIFGLWYLTSHSLLPLSAAVLYTVWTVFYLYRQRALLSVALVAAIVAAALAPGLTSSPNHAHAAALPAPALPYEETIHASQNCWIATGSWLVVTTGLLISAPTGWGLIVGAWGEVVAINGVVTNCTENTSGLPFYWTLIYWSGGTSGGGGGGSW
jgi:hypothetical protein